MNETDSTQNVTLVTRNEKAAVFELVVWLGFLYYVTHPNQVEIAKDKLRAFRDRTIYRIDVWQTRNAIQSLPETPSSLRG